jgi:hypothetical protein
MLCWSRKIAHAARTALQLFPWPTGWNQTNLSGPLRWVERLSAGAVAPAPWTVSAHDPVAMAASIIHSGTSARSARRAAVVAAACHDLVLTSCCRQLVARGEVVILPHVGNQRVRLPREAEHGRAVEDHLPGRGPRPTAQRVWRSLHVKHPMVDLRLFADGNLAATLMLARLRLRPTRHWRVHE